MNIIQRKTVFMVCTHLFISLIYAVVWAYSYYISGIAWEVMAKLYLPVIVVTMLIYSMGYDHGREK